MGITRHDIDSYKTEGITSGSDGQNGDPQIIVGGHDPLGHQFQVRPLLELIVTGLTEGSEGTGTLWFLIDW